MTNEELLESRQKAWEEWNEYEYRTYQPRWYKQKKGFINPWISTDELKQAMIDRAGYARRYYELASECHDRKLPALVSDFVWYEEQTPDGKRYRRRNEN